MTHNAVQSERLKKITADVGLAVVLAVMATCVAEAEPSVVQTGVTVYDKARAYPLLRALCGRR